MSRQILQAKHCIKKEKEMVAAAKDEETSKAAEEAAAEAVDVAEASEEASDA